MRILTNFLFLFVLVSCNKDANLEDDFNRLVGDWKSVEGDDLITMKVKKNGKISISKSFERYEKTLIVAIEEDSSTIPQFNYFTIFKESDESVFRYHINSTNDSIYLNGIGGFTKDYHFNYNNILLIRTQ